MALLSWSSTSLPQAFEVDGFGREPGNNVKTSGTDNGEGRRRRAFTGVPGMMSGVMHMTAAQFASLQTIYGTNLADGVLPFYFPRQPPDAGDDHLCRFAEIWRLVSAPADDQHVVAIKLHILP